MVTLHSNACHNSEINNKWPHRFLHHRHIDDEFCTKCSSCGGQGVTGDSVTLQQKDPSKDQHGSLPIVAVKCPTKQRLWNIFLASETLYSISISSKTQYSTPQIIFLTHHEFSSVPSTGWLFLPNLVAAQLWNSPRLLPKNYSWLLPRQQIFWNSHSIEVGNVWSLNVMPVHRQFTFYPRTQYESIMEAIHIRTPHTKIS